MQPEFEEHLLSAYLDEELSADERALVEQRLAVDPVARELLEDLKRLRGLVATLPAWNGQDLAFDALPLNRTDDHDSGASLDGSGSERTSLSTSEDLTSALTRPSAQVDRSRYQTRRSMRWTAMVALAAGIATVAFGLPYLVPGLKPAQDLALLKEGDQQSPPTGAAAVEPPPTASSPVASAPAAAGQLDGASESFYLRPEPKQRSDADATRDPADGSSAKSLAERLGESAPTAPGRGATSLGVEGRFDPDSAALRAEDALAYDPRGSRAAGAGGADALSRLPRSGFAPPEPGAAESNRSFNVAPPAAGFAAGAASAAGNELAAGVPPAGAAAGGMGGVAPQLPSISSAWPDASEPRMKKVQPSFYYANSSAWSPSEVDSALPEVWSYIDPAAAVAVGNYRSVEGAELAGGQLFGAQANGQRATYQDFGGITAGATTGAASPTASSAAAEAANPSAAAASGAADARKENRFARDLQADNNRSSASGNAYYDNATSANAQSTPAVGLALLPADNTVEQWYERLKQDNHLQPLNQLVEGRQLPEVALKARANALDPADSARQTRGAVDTQSLALFVNAAEARKILSTIDSERRQAAQRMYRQDSPQAGQAGGLPVPAEQNLSKDRVQELESVDADKKTPAPALNAPETTNGGMSTLAGGSVEVQNKNMLPPAWWARSRALIENGPSADDTKVILILNQPVPQP